MLALNSGHTIGNISDPGPVWLHRIELALQSVRRNNMTLSTSASRRTITDLSLEPSKSHKTMYSVDTASEPHITQVRMDFPVTVDATGFKPRLFNHPAQLFIGLMLSTDRLPEPSVVTAGLDFQHATLPAHRPLSLMFPDEGVPQSDSFAKYAAAFFNISRSSVARLSSFCRRRILACASLSSAC